MNMTNRHNNHGGHNGIGGGQHGNMDMPVGFKGWRDRGAIGKENRDGNEPVRWGWPPGPGLSQVSFSVRELAGCLFFPCFSDHQQYLFISISCFHAYPDVPAC